MDNKPSDEVLGGSGTVAAVTLPCEEKPAPTRIRVTQNDMDILAMNLLPRSLEVAPDRVFLFCSDSWHPFRCCVCVGVADYGGQLTLFFVGLYDIGHSDYANDREKLFIQSCVVAVNLFYPHCGKINFVTDHHRAVRVPLANAVLPFSNIVAIGWHDATPIDPKRKMPMIDDELTNELERSLRAHTLYLHLNMSGFELDNYRMRHMSRATAIGTLCWPTRAFFMFDTCQHSHSHPTIRVLALVHSLRTSPDLRGCAR